MSKVIFVGNVPYNMAEEQLIEVFKSAGQVVGFRLVYDRDTGKPKGYGFCEFADHETALSAVRNLNNTEVGGRALRIDIADSDPFLEGKTTVRGELQDGQDSRWRDGDKKSDPKAFLAEIPTGLPVPPGSTSADMITSTLANMDPALLIEVLAQMKAFVITHPEQAKALLQAHPQYGYALFQAMLLNRIVDPAILQRMLAASAATTPTSNATMHPPYPPYGAPSGVPPAAAPPPSHPGPFPPVMPPAMPQGMYYRPPGPPAAVPPPAHPTPPPAATTQAQPEITESQQRSMLMQVLSLTPEQINSLPDQERAAIQQLRSQFMGTLSSGPP